MQVLVAYAGKTGTTANAASIFARALIQRGVDVELCDLTSTHRLPSTYDAVVVGSSIRMGKLHKEALIYLKDNRTKLLAFPLGLFCCRCGKDDTRALFSAQLDPKLITHAFEIASFGGELELNKQKGLDRLAVGMLLKKKSMEAMKPEGIQQERIFQFADALLKAVHHD